MNDYKLTFKLKQHTPIIHFQHDQQGATLRASEVKPKLDLFIMKRILISSGKHFPDHKVREEFKKIANKNWLVGRGKAEHVALDYKIKINDVDSRPFNQRSFGNIKLITETIRDKKAISSNEIIVNIICMDANLKKTVEGQLELFFLIENFGTRQNKAWGSFSHEATVDWIRAKSTLLDSELPVYVYRDAIPTHNRETNTNSFYPNVMDKWRILKSGKNHEVYYKSKLFKYLCENEIRWDKRWMKVKLKKRINSGLLPYQLKANRTPTGFNQPNDCCTPIDPCNDNSCNNQSWQDDSKLNYEYRFGRAMLGLPEHIEFQAYAPGLNRYIYQVIVKSIDGLERFKAPVTFKIFDDRLYAIAHEPTNMYGKSFKFSIQKKKSENRGEKPESDGSEIPIVDAANNDLLLSTPLNANEFNLTRFLDRYMSCSEINFERLTNQNTAQL